MSIQKSLKNAMLTGNGLISWQNNTPVQYSGKQRQYFSPETRTFTQMYAQYSSDFVEAQIQGIDPDNPLAWQTRFLRFSDVVKPSAAIQRHFDDYKMILVADKDIEYIVPGSKIVTMGNTWLVVNPMNVSGSDGAALVRRCNAVWNYLDYYGNVISEPIIAENERANANDSDTQNSQLISKGYFNIICQNNDATRQIDTNTRMILGTGAYRVTGYSDFEMEFTGDYSSVRLLSFTARYEAPNLTIDDLENHVAGGKAFSWEIIILGAAQLAVGAQTYFAAISERNGASVESVYLTGKTLHVDDSWSVVNGILYAPDGTRVDGKTLISGENPTNYLWSSSDESVLTVDENGLATAVSAGSAVLTATLAQNPAYSVSMTVTVAQSADCVSFVSSVDLALYAYQSTTIRAAYFENGEETDEPLEWAFTGAEKGSYSAEISPDGKSATVACYGYSETPLTVTISHNGTSASAEIALGGL